MPDIEASLAVIAESYRSIDTATQVMARLLARLDERVDRLGEIHRLGLRLQGCALALLGLSLLGTGCLLWRVLAR